MNEAQIKELFIFHPLKPEQVDKYQALRNKALEYALLIQELCPESREKSLAITNLQQSNMFAVGSIAIHS